MEISYSSWKKVCDYYFSENEIFGHYLQWHPFIKLKENNKEFIKSKEFYEKFVHNFSIFFIDSFFETYSYYIQKTNGSFRKITLVNPITYLFIESFGNEVFQKFNYKLKNKKTFKSYYSGNIKENDYYYKENYDNFKTDLNNLSLHYKYYYKSDIENFFNNINIDLLFRKINNTNQIINPKNELIFKNLLKSLEGSKFPCIENSTSLSYIASYIYLEEFDKNIIDKINGMNELKDFYIIRYVDDLYIFFNSNLESEIKKIEAKIKNYLTEEYFKLGLTLNQNKTKLMKSKNIIENEKMTLDLYNYYVNGEIINYKDYFKSTKLIEFLEEIYNSSSEMNHERYDEIKKNIFSEENIEYSSQEVFKQYIYKQKDMFKDEKIIELLTKILKNDIDVKDCNVREFTMMVTNTQDGKLIKLLLSKILLKSNLSLFDLYYATSYLLQRDFRHIDLINKIRENNEEIYGYINKFCINYELKFEEDYQFILRDNIENYFKNDLKIWYLYFMYKINEKENNVLESFSYFRSYFDRITSVIMFKYDIIKTKKNKPDYKRHYKLNNLKTDYERLDIKYYTENDVEKTLEALCNLRNDNPINHSSSGILDKSSLNIEEINSIMFKINLLINHSLKI